MHAGGGQLEAGVERRHRQQVVAGEEPVPPDEVEQRAEVERLLGAGRLVQARHRGAAPGTPDFDGLLRQVDLKEIGELRRADGDSAYCAVAQDDRL